MDLNLPSDWDLIDLRVDLQSCLYSTNELKPRWVLVTSHQDDRLFPGIHYPYAKNFMSHSQTQPYVHNCIIIVHKGIHAYKFMVLFKNHLYLPHNNCLAGFSQYSHIHGDVLVMQIGVRLNYVNMREQDNLLADWFMKRYWSMCSAICPYLFLFSL